MKNLYKIVLIISLLMGLCIYYINKTAIFVTAEFRNLRPFHYSAPIYYNGFNIGKVIKVKPNKTYTSTIVTLWLYPHDLKLPTNIEVHLKKEKNKQGKIFDYIDIIYPEVPSGYFLKDGDRVAGKTTVELETFLANQDPETLEAIKNDFAQTVKNLNITIQTLGDLFATLNSMAEEIKPNVVNASSDLQKSSNNFAKVSQNVNTLSENVNSALNKDRLNSTAKNVQIMSKNMRLMTNEINKTIPQVQSAVCEVNEILSNVDDMTSGLNCTMKKPFGGLRLIFGSPISKKNCQCK